MFDDELPTNGEVGAPAASSAGRADEIFSRKIEARSRIFYIDLKESPRGKFIKISEKSRGGQRSTIMFDGEDLDAFIETFTEIKGKM